MKTRIRISGKTNEKLMFVKLIERYTGLGFKESKELMDQFNLEIDIENSDVKNAIVEFKKIGLTVTNISRKLKLKRILYHDQTSVIIDMLENVSQ